MRRGRRFATEHALGGVVILEAEGARQGLSALAQLPAGNLRQQFGQAGFAELVVAALRGTQRAWASGIRSAMGISTSC
ncbi:hypothetical protein VM57_13240 [Stenotrophomonas maltophilia]|uniref:Uncharacterized protein n=1 Tax=Stenotrophomonas maltophilia TaxID=40324 RepID=A0A0F5ZN32_STEMA|nr:hypothetical protein VM57_13240 [Stenotrophomonas maltophilia]